MYSMVVQQLNTLIKTLTGVNFVQNICFWRCDKSGVFNDTFVDLQFREIRVSKTNEVVARIYYTLTGQVQDFFDYERYYDLG